MEMDERRFREHLLIFGADLSKWPEEARAEGKEALAKYPDLMELLRDHEGFEKALRERRFEEPGVDLSERIIAASLREEERAPFPIWAFLSELLGEFGLKRPAYAAVSLALVFSLITGFVIGYANPLGLNGTSGEQVSLQEYLYDEGDVG